MKTSSIGLKYKFFWPTRYFRAPLEFDYVQSQSIPHKRSYHQKNFEDEVSLCFFGDFMGTGSKSIELGNNLIHFMNSTDYSLINLESVLIEKSDPILAKQYSYPSSFKSLTQQISPQKLLVNLANNHLYDYGLKGFNSTVNCLHENGVKYFGIKGCEYFRIKNNLIIDGQTLWKGSSDDLSNQQFNLYQDDQVIKYIHWGEEFYPDPTDEQIDFFNNGNELLVIGHHSHCPQKIVERNGRICAYSLGNFACASNLEKINHGIALKVKLVKIQHQWIVAESNWKFLRISSTKNKVMVDLES